MPSPRDDAQRQADLDWLYGDRQAEPNQTRVMNQSESAELNRRAKAAADATGRARSTDELKPISSRQRKAEVDAYLNARQQVTASGSHRARPPRRHRRRRVWPWIVGLLVLALVWLIAVPLHAYSQIGRIDLAPAGPRPAEQPGTAVLIVGSDSRDHLTQRQRGQLGTGSAEGARTDTMMLLYTPPRGRSVLVGLPRDSYVPIPGHNKNKLNAAYSIGGPSLLVDTVEQNTGLRIDGYLEIGFDGFVHLTDAVGGVRLCLKEPMKDKDSHTDLPAGCQRLNGVQALGYVRMRKADPEGDIGRMRRQREFMAAIAKEAANPMTVLNPGRYWKTTHAAADAVRLGSDTSMGEVVSAGRGMMSVARGKGISISVPISNPNASTAAGSAVLWDEEQSKALFDQLASGDMDNIERFAK